jgi:hypothetical protein
MSEYAVNANGCWVWLGKITGRGYGAIPVGKTNHVAHRVFYERANGVIPDGLVLDHLCRNIRCVNPDHLEPVTSKENTLRGIGPTAINAMKTHCPKGHLYSDGNLRLRRDRRYCMACDTEHKQAYRDRLIKKPRPMPERRSEIAREAAQARWRKYYALAPEQEK